MTVPTNRQDFKNYCLRKLGAPVIQINVSEEQVDDAVDAMLYLYATYHMEGSDKTYYTYSVTEQDIQNRYITLPQNIIGAVRLFPIGDALNTNSLFNMRYQFVINDLYNISNVSLIPYYMVMEHVQFLEQMLVGQQPIRYNRHNNICYLDMDWDQITVGEFLCVECYMVLDPTVYSGLWSDKWAQDYCTAQIKQRWGSILSLMELPMPGQIKLNGQKIYNDATMEIERLEKKLLKAFSIPPNMFIG
jgi:hypothetical protein